MSEFNLSEKRQEGIPLSNNKKKYLYKEEDVKEFIKKIKEEIKSGETNVNTLGYKGYTEIKYVFEVIDELAGNGLIGQKEK